MPDNAFDPELLEALAERDLPQTAEKAELAGPWEVRRWEKAWGVFSLGDAQPRAVFLKRELALAAALYPAGGHEHAYVLGADKEEQGFPVRGFRGGPNLDLVGWLAYYEVELVENLSGVEHALRSPVSLALVLEGAGKEALDRAGAILALRVLRAADAEDPAAAVARTLGVEVTPELRQAVEAMRRQLGLEGDGARRAGRHRRRAGRPRTTQGGDRKPQDVSWPPSAWPAARATLPAPSGPGPPT